MVRDVRPSLYMTIRTVLFALLPVLQSPIRRTENRCNDIQVAALVPRILLTVIGDDLDSGFRTRTCGIIPAVDADPSASFFLLCIYTVQSPRNAIPFFVGTTGIIPPTLSVSTYSAWSTRIGPHCSKGFLDHSTNVFTITISAKSQSKYRSQKKPHLNCLSLLALCDMAAEKLVSVANSRPFRITALVLLFIISFYIANPFAQSALSRSSSATESAWFDWKSAPQEEIKDSKDDNTSAHHAQEGGPRIRQASMIYSSNDYNAVYERAVASHIRHGDRWGVPTHVLRHDIVEAGFFNKPAYLLGLVIEELSKPYGQRADWIV